MERGRRKEVTTNINLKIKGLVDFSFHGKYIVRVFDVSLNLNRRRNGFV